MTSTRRGVWQRRTTTTRSWAPRRGTRRWPRTTHWPSDPHRPVPPLTSSADGRVRKQRDPGVRGRPLIQVGGQPLVDLLACHRLEPGPHGDVDRCVPDEGSRVLGAPPVELLATLAPVAASHCRTTDVTRPSGEVS